MEGSKTMYEKIKAFFMGVEPGLHEVFDFIDKYLR